MANNRLPSIAENTALPHGTCILDVESPSYEEHLGGSVKAPSWPNFAISIQGVWSDVIEIPPERSDQSLARYLHAKADAADLEGKLGFNVDMEPLQYGKFPQVLEVFPGSWASKKHINIGDVLTNINMKDVLGMSMGDLQKELEDCGSNVLFRFERLCARNPMHVPRSPALRWSCPSGLQMQLRYSESKRQCLKPKKPDEPCKIISPHLILELTIHLNDLKRKHLRQKLPCSFSKLFIVEVVLADRKIYFKFDGEKQIISSRASRLSNEIFAHLRRGAVHDVWFETSESWKWNYIFHHPVEIQAFDDDGDDDNVGDPYHIIFVVDRSQSMRTPDVKLDERRCCARIRAVRNIVHDYIHLAPSSQRDHYSLVLFADDFKLKFVALSQEEALEQVEDEIETGGGTQFTSAIHGICAVHRASLKTRIIILSDGCPGDSYLDVYNHWLRKIGNQAQSGHVQVFTVGLGVADQHAVARLQQLAALGGGGYYPSDLSSDALRSSFGRISQTITSQRRTTSSHSTLHPERPIADHQTTCGKHEACDEYELPLQFNMKPEKIDAQRYEYVFTGTQFEKTTIETEVCWRQRPFQRGGLRQVFSMVEGFDKQRVAKFPRWVNMDNNASEVFAQQTAVASFFVNWFCLAVGLKQEKFDYIPCYAYYAKRWNSDGTIDEYRFNGEDVLVGRFVKWNSNEGWVNRVDMSFEAEAFSHFSYEASCHKLMVVDIQGIQNSGCSALTDPQVLSVEQCFGPGDLGSEGMEACLSSHECNFLCDKWRAWRNSPAARSEDGNRANLCFTDKISVGPVVEVVKATTAAQPLKTRKKKTPTLEQLLRKQSKVGRKRR